MAYHRHSITCPDCEDILRISFTLRPGRDMRGELGPSVSKLQGKRLPNVCFWHKADVPTHLVNVCFWG